MAELILKTFDYVDLYEEIQTPDGHLIRVDGLQFHEMPGR